MKEMEAQGGVGQKSNVSKINVKKKTLEKPYLCCICLKGFTKQVSLNRHMKQCHPGQKGQDRGKEEAEMDTEGSKEGSQKSTLRKIKVNQKTLPEDKKDEGQRHSDPGLKDATTKNLSKLPTDMYVKVTQIGTNLNEMDTTDSDNSLKSLQVN